ncbi:hypothetical protein [Halopiger djelfimassiliensis]|uniref:hypothetical protein n=1 Tax=Halopiger djelfimassiliensis TaxID=1293047 RepID=UPI000677E223|nr:hypothetical protein [Halopiger djelfimassiliensis]
MSSDLETDERVQGDHDRGISLPQCPNCGRPVTIVTTIGPTEGVATPCGCHVPPTLFRDE